MKSSVSRIYFFLADDAHLLFLCGHREIKILENINTEANILVDLNILLRISCIWSDRQQ